MWIVKELCIALPSILLATLFLKIQYVTAAAERPDAESRISAYNFTFPNAENCKKVRDGRDIYVTMQGDGSERIAFPLNVSADDKLFVGKIESEPILIDQNSRRKLRITIINDREEKMDFVINPASFHNHNMNNNYYPAGMRVSSIDKGDEVFVLYNTERNGQNQVTFMQTLEVRDINPKTRAPLVEKRIHVSDKTRLLIGRVVSGTVIIDLESKKKVPVIIEDIQGREINFIVDPSLSCIFEEDPDHAWERIQQGDEVFVLYDTMNDNVNILKYIHTILGSDFLLIH